MVPRAPAEKINEWAKKRGWNSIGLVSGYGTTYQEDYRCQGENEDMQWPIMHVFRKVDGEVRHFWGTELQGNHVYWHGFSAAEAEQLGQQLGMTSPPG